LICAWLVLFSPHALASTAPQTTSATGTVEGRVASAEGHGSANVLVVLEQLGRVTSTDHNGSFRFADLPAGTYSLVLSTGELESRISSVDVRPGAVTTVTRTMPADFRFVASTTVTAASRSPERIVDAPGAVTRISDETIALEGASGQIPALLQFTPGVEYAQSGLYDINLNARGFNNLLSRRIQTLLDGRDTAAPESSTQEWYGLGFLTEDLESIELLRGPSASLYGANTVNGVLTLRTKAPRDSLGGRARLTFGELDTVIGDVRWAGRLTDAWYMKAVGNVTHSTSFTRPRTTTVEYANLPKDVIAPPDDTIDARSGALRFDRYRSNGDLLTVEGGFSHSSGETFVAQAGRASIGAVRRGWARSEYASQRFNLSAEYNARGGDQMALQAGVPLYTSSQRFRATAQGHEYFQDGRVRAVFGSSFQRESVDSADPNGVQTLFQNSVTSNFGAAFAQIDYVVNRTLKVVGGLRWDDASIHPAQWSPRLAAVVRLAPGQSLRIGYNRGFQVGTYTELYLRVPAAPPLVLSALEGALAPALGGVRLGFETVPIFAIGNPGLDVEKIQGVDIGYTGVFGSRARVGLEFYRNSMRDFISDLLFGINPAYPPYQAPSSLPAPVRTLVETTVNGLLPGLTNRTDGGPQIILSNANTGRVHSRGLEASVGVSPVDGMWLDASYTWFDFTLKDKQPGAEPQPNAPAHRAAAGVTYTRDRTSASLRYRWVDAFQWASGVYVGPVPAYGVADLNVRFKASPRWELGVNVANLFDNRHYEMFGGDLLGRRLLVHPTFVW
jgi:outer membrane receptor protein involved in Fe transport